MWWDLWLSFYCKFLASVTAKEFWKLVNIWRSYGQEFSVLFFDSRCISDTASVSSILPLQRNCVTLSCNKMWNVQIIKISYKVLTIHRNHSCHSKSRNRDGFCAVYKAMLRMQHKAPFIVTQLNSTQLNCQLSIRRRRVGGSERRDPVEVVCGSWRHVWCKIATKFANLCDCMIR